MFAAILKLLSGSVLDRFTSLYEKKLAAENDEKRLAVDLAIEQLSKEMQIAQNVKEVRLATAGFWEMRVITFLIAAPLAVHQLLVVYDTCDTSVNLAIPALPYPFSEYQGTILLSFFGAQLVAKGFDSMAYIFGKRKC